MKGKLYGWLVQFDFERKLIVEDWVDGAEKSVQVWHKLNACKLSNNDDEQEYEFSMKYGTLELARRVNREFSRSLVTEINIGEVN